MKKLRIILIMAVFCLLTGCANQVKDGVALLEEGKYQDAIDTFQEAIDKDKNLGESYRGQGMAYYELADYDKARQAFEEALSNDVEKTPTIYNLIGICYMNLENIDSAMNNFNLGVSVAQNVDADSDTDYSEVVQEMQYNLIVCYERKSDWESAKTKMSKYIAQYPDDADAQKEAQFLETR